MTAKTIARFFIWLYPLFLGVLLFWGWTSYQRLGELQYELERAHEDLEERIEEARRRWGSEEDIAELRQVVRLWRERAGARHADVPVALKNIADEAGWELTDYVSRGRVIRNDTAFEHVDVTLKGETVFELLPVFERHPEVFISISSIAVRPGRIMEGVPHEIRLTLFMLLD